MSLLQRFLSDNAQTLVSLVPAVRDASTEAVHDARVASRRLRGALEIVSTHQPERRLEEATAMARRAARALGRVRDIDVSLELLKDLERRAPAAAPGAAACRRELLRARTAARRKLVNRFDTLPIDTLPKLVASAQVRVGRLLAARARERAQILAEAVNHASGVYFPRRAHAARIELKKLRYLLEFSRYSDADLKLLRKAQEVLGDIQDRQVLHRLAERMRDDKLAGKEEMDPLLELLEAECTVMYDRFLERRSEILALCRRVSDDATPGFTTLKGTLITVAVVAAGSYWQLHRQRPHDDVPSIGLESGAWSVGPGDARQQEQTRRDQVAVGGR
jgi:CHAD domain-containing protein